VSNPRQVSAWARCDVSTESSAAPGVWGGFVELAGNEGGRACLSFPGEMASFCALD
jgi:hypothetical protein